MKHIKAFDKFSKINELWDSTSEFNLQRMNPDSVQASVHVDDPQLSLNAFDKNQDMIRQAMSKLNGILTTLSNSTGYRALKAFLGLDNQKIQKLLIKRIVKNNVDFDVYVVFFIDDVEYWGVISSILSRSPDVKSEVFKDHDLVQTKDWIIKTKGLLVKVVKNWLRVDRGEYILENEYANCYDVDNGSFVRLQKGSKVTLIRSFDNKCLIKYENRYYNLINENFIYFNYWFKKV
jgi:hypothetical protein